VPGAQPIQRDRHEATDRGFGVMPPGPAESVDAVARQLVRRHVVPHPARLHIRREQFPDQQVDPVGYKNSSRGAVLVDETTQHVSSANVRCSQVTHRWPSAPGRRPKIKAAMGPGFVVMSDVGAKDAFQVSSAEDERPVQALGSDGAHPAFAERVGGWGPGSG
jgi:hypothetical protein